MVRKECGDWINAQLEPKCIGVEPCKRPFIWSTYSWRMQHLQGRIDDWSNCNAERFLLHHCSCIKVCSRWFHTHRKQYCRKPSERCFLNPFRKKSVDS